MSSQPLSELGSFWRKGLIRLTRTILTFIILASVLGRERPAAISIEIKSIDDTSNFDEFPESDILKPTGNTTTAL